VVIVRAFRVRGCGTEGFGENTPLSTIRGSGPEVLVSDILPTGALIV